MNEILKTDGQTESTEQTNQIDMSAKCDELRRDIAGLLRFGERGTELLQNFCSTSSIAVDSDLTEAVVAHFESLDRKPRTLSKFRRRISLLITEARKK